MSTPTQQRPRPQQQAPAQDRDAALLNQILDKEVEFTPFMEKDPIRLSARLVLRYLCTPTKSGRVCDEKQAVKFIMLCKARGLNPWEGDAFIVGYDGQDGPQFSLITAHQAFLKRAEVHPEYDGMESGVVVRRKRFGPEGEEVVTTEELQGDLFEEGDALLGGWATVHFKNRKHPMKKRLRLSVFNTGRSRWKIDPAGMIVKCAEADALRSAFPNSLGGMYLEGEIPGAVTRPADPTPPPVGRTSLRNGNGSAPPPPAPEPAAEETPTEPPPEPTPEDPHKNAITLEISQQIQEAADPDDLDATGERLGQDREYLGEERYASLLQAYQARQKELRPAAGKGRRADF